MNDTTCTCTPSCHKFFAVTLVALIIACGTLSCGWFIAKGLYRIKMDDRYVSAKGLSERGVKADLALWSITFTESGDDLHQVNTKGIADQKTILTFLTSHGFVNEEIESGQTTVVDQYASEYRQNNKPEPRYIINSTLKVRSSKVDLIKATSKLTTDLIAQGIVLANKDFGPNPRYLFTKLDSIRPAMLEEATKSARLAANQFAINSDSKLGKIKHASQGVFQIFSADASNSQQGGDMDQESAINKTVRVVSSVDYFLEN
jgi:uncharacterized protein